MRESLPFPYAPYMPKSRSTPRLRHIGGVLRDKRERRDEDQLDVAERAEVSVDHYRDIENGRVPASRRTYLRIARALDIDEDDMDEMTQEEAGVA